MVDYHGCHLIQTIGDMLLHYVHYGQHCGWILVLCTECNNLYVVGKISLPTILCLIYVRGFCSFSMGNILEGGECPPCRTFT